MADEQSSTGTAEGGGYSGVTEDGAGYSGYDPGPSQSDGTSTATTTAPAAPSEGDGGYTGVTEDGAGYSGYSGSAGSSDDGGGGYSGTTDEGAGYSGYDPGQAYSDGSGYSPQHQEDQPSSEDNYEGWEGWVELAVASGLHYVGHAIAHAAGGLVALLIDIVQIPGDVQLKPAQPDEPAPSGAPVYGAYVAACPERHPLVYNGVTNDSSIWISSVGEQLTVELEAGAHSREFGHQCHLYGIDEHREFHAIY